MIDAFYDEETAQNLAYDAAFGFLGEAEIADEVAYWSVHCPDEHRFHNTLCLFYGAKADEREEFANDMGLPEDRALTCPEEFDLAYDSCGVAFDDIAGRGNSPRFDAGGFEGLTLDVIASVVAALNADFLQPELLGFTVERCGEANACYGPDTIRSSCASRSKIIAPTV
jgi:hypothetical protein